MTPGEGLFDGPWSESLGPGASVLHGFAAARGAELLTAVMTIAGRAPFRHLSTPGGLRMSVAMTSCGALGWHSDGDGYRYVARDPPGGAPWPAMPEAFRALAEEAATAAGFAGFRPDACLINRYAPGARMTLHQDRNERSLDSPVVSLSLGLPATFLFGGDTRTGPTQRVLLSHGDVVVWGGPARLRFHGVLPLKDGHHPLAGALRFNLTFRRAG